MKEKIVSFHIEKTGGTSLERLYRGIFGDEFVLLYDPLTDSFRKASTEIVARTSPFIDGVKYLLDGFPFLAALNKIYINTKKVLPHADNFDDIRVVHGHFSVDRVDIHDKLLAVVLREPLERMISQYSHWQRTRGQVEWRVMIPFDSSMTFEEFSILPIMKNYQSQVLCGKDIAGFDFVGVTEKLDVFASQICIYALSQFGIHGEFDLMKLNKTRRKQIEVNNDFAQLFRKVHADDYEIYEKALSMPKVSMI